MYQENQEPEDQLNSALSAALEDSIPGPSEETQDEEQGNEDEATEDAEADNEESAEGTTEEEESEESEESDDQEDDGGMPPLPKDINSWAPEQQAAYREAQRRFTIPLQRRADALRATQEEIEKLRKQVEDLSAGGTEETKKPGAQKQDAEPEPDPREEPQKWIEWRIQREVDARLQALQGDVKQTTEWRAQQQRQTRFQQDAQTLVGKYPELKDPQSPEAQAMQAYLADPRNAKLVRAYEVDNVLSLEHLYHLATVNSDVAGQRQAAARASNRSARRARAATAGTRPPGKKAGPPPDDLDACLEASMEEIPKEAFYH